jgi:hypothetical protein
LLISNLKFQNLKSLAEAISRQLRGWAQHLHDSPIRGQHYLHPKRMAIRLSATATSF